MTNQTYVGNALTKTKRSLKGAWEDEASKLREEFYPTKVLNAQIENTMLGFEDHGILTFSLGMRFDGNSYQSFGLTGCGEYNKKLGYQVGSKYGMDCVAHILKTVGVDTWEELKGKLVRIRHGQGRIVAIGNYMANNWFSIGFPDGKFKVERSDKVIVE